MTSTETTLTGERADLVQTLVRHRGFFRHTVRGLTDEQATQRTTASERTLAGLIKHVAHTEQKWADFARRGAKAFDMSNWSIEAWKAEWSLQPGETLAGVLAEYEQFARRTDVLTATRDLAASYELPMAPWFEPGALWSVRRARTREPSAARRR